QVPARLRPPRMSGGRDRRAVRAASLAPRARLAYALAWLPALAAATPSVSGLYKGDLGLLEFTTDGAHVAGRLQASNVCEFSGEPLLVEGDLEGSVLVGKVMLCQNGAGCHDKSYPLVAYY